jgi:hypothetical protein
MRSLFFLLFCSATLPCFATTTIQGCHNGSAIYTKYLGKTNFWGTYFDVYSSTTDPIEIYTNNDGQNTAPCGEIYATGTTSLGSQCWLAPSVPATNTQSGVQWGTKYEITGNYVPCPIDGYVWFLVFGSGFVGYMSVKTRSA